MWVIYWGRGLESGILAWHACCHFPQEGRRESACFFSIWVVTVLFSVVCGPVEYHATKNSPGVLSFSVQAGPSSWVDVCKHTWDTVMSSAFQNCYCNIVRASIGRQPHAGASQICAVLYSPLGRSRSALLASPPLARWRRVCEISVFFHPPYFTKMSRCEMSFCQRSVVLWDHGSLGPEIWMLSKARKVDSGKRT